MTAQICVQISVLLLTAPSRPHSLLHKNKHLPRAAIRIWFGSRGRGGGKRIVLLLKEECSYPNGVPIAHLNLVSLSINLKFHSWYAQKVNEQKEAGKKS